MPEIRDWHTNRVLKVVEGTTLVGADLSGADLLALCGYEFDDELFPWQ